MERGEPQGNLDTLCREAVGGSLGEEKCFYFLVEEKYVCFYLGIGGPRIRWGISGEFISNKISRHKWLQNFHKTKVQKKKARKKFQSCLTFLRWFDLNHPSPPEESQWQVCWWGGDIGQQNCGEGVNRFYWQNIFFFDKMLSWKSFFSSFYWQNVMFWRNFSPLLGSGRLPGHKDGVCSHIGKPLHRSYICPRR